jgi:hypothetical protein
MPCARKRLHERGVILIDDIAFRMGYLCKRVLAFDLGAMNRTKFDTLKRMNRRSRSPDERRRDLTRGKDAAYWSQTAASLTKEVAQLREDAKKRDREYSSLFECNSRLFASYKEMERKLNDAERELTYLRTDPFQESRVYSSVISTIPLNTEGKDVIHWHQTCRTVQAQYQEAKREIDEKTSQFILLSKRIKELESMLQNK